MLPLSGCLPALRSTPAGPASPECGPAEFSHWLSPPVFLLARSLQDLQAQNAVLQKLLNVRDSAIDVLGSAGAPGSTQPARQAQQAQQQVQRQASGGSQSALQQQQSASSSLDREASGGEIAGAASMTSTVARHMQRLQVELSAQLAQVTWGGLRCLQRY